MRPVWAWLRDDKNRDIVRMTAAGLAALVAGLWAVWTFAGDHSSPGVTAGAGGMAAGHDITGNTVTFAAPAAGHAAAVPPAGKPP